MIKLYKKYDSEEKYIPLFISKDILYSLIYSNRYKEWFYLTYKKDFLDTLNNKEFYHEENIDKINDISEKNKIEVIKKLFIGKN